MDVRNISNSGPDDKKQEKFALLWDAPGVTRLVRVYCHRDPAWSLQLLQRAAPTLERLCVRYPREAHLLAVHTMPRLTRLDVDAALAAQGPELPDLPPGHGGHGLQWLRVGNLPRAWTRSLLRAHGGTLEELQLLVGTAESKGTSYSCDDLNSLLQRSGLRALRRLVLRRVGWIHQPAACREQRAEVRGVLPGAEVLVLCDKCDHVEKEEV
ncbi:uncharacterized protein LOC113209670 [Frankliniella occidentalis]|uniref:Uncharacterized protein LOC113209670 n=1 Tax=Frankliniella occidentalis TaxID=133901 RepID=A0A9C6X8W2_FRAOC|nr:uncharacterized protein LOC113209670 [Frankliniella occidentalis]